MKIPKMAKIDKCPPFGSCPNKTPPPGQKLGLATEWGQMPGVVKEGVVIAKLDNRISLYSAMNCFLRSLFLFVQMNPIFG